ncbi:MAG: hypothetical protein JWL71_496 [Acidobacteria bacterium]|nr:hypothetical protein [Acidobacteriota bacterium]
MTGKDDPLLHFRRRHVRDEVEVLIGRSAVRVIVALVTLAFAAAFGWSDPKHARDLIEMIRRLPSF